MTSVHRTTVWLRRSSLLLAILALVSYSQGAHIGWRYVNPPLGAWWNLHEFWLMEAGATAFGAIVGFAVAARWLAEIPSGDRLEKLSLLGLAVLLLPLTALCARAARFEWTQRGDSLRSWAVGLAGYEAGIHLDNLLITGVYCLKTAFFAALFGLALAGLATMGASLVAARDSDERPA